MKNTMWFGKPDGDWFPAVESEEEALEVIVLSMTKYEKE